jgi:hypothetical protein
MFLSLCPPKVQSFSRCCRITPDSSLKAQSQSSYIALNRLGRAEGLVLLCCEVSTMRRDINQGVSLGGSYQGAE